MKPNPFAFRFLLWLALACCTLAFTGDAPMSQYTIPIAARSVSSADLDLDGDIDITIGHNTAWQKTNKTISVLANINAGYFNISDTLKSYCGYQVNIFACKIDNDEYPDLVTFYSDFSSGTAKRYIRVWYNENGNFHNYLDFSLNSSATFSGITYGDVNGDDLNDILVLSNDNRFYGVLLNNGNGGLTSATYYSIPEYPPLGIACDDLNNDGWDDVVVCGQFLEIYYSTVSGFQKQIIDSAAFKDKVAISDFDLDGLKDIVADNGAVVNNVWTNIYQNTGSGNFVKLSNYFFPPRATEFSVTDFNNDNLPDIAYLIQFPDTTGTGITDTAGGIKIAYNLGDFQLSEPQLVKIDNYGEDTRHFNCADFDNNGFNDFAITRGKGIYFSNLVLLFNDGNGNFVSTPFVGIDEVPVPAVYFGCYPNPFHEQTTFEFEIKTTSRVELCVYDFQGRCMQSLINGKLNAGHYSISWSGFSRDNAHHNTNVLVACLKVNRVMQKSIKLIQL